MEDRAHGRGYSHAHASRLAPKPSKLQQQQNAATKKKHGANAKRVAMRTPSRGVVHHSNASSSGARKSLVDAFKQHGMRLCDGTKLNAVGKAIQCIGSVPPAVSATISALFLSQNNLRSLDGAEQFVTLRLLSIGGNLLASFAELERLTKLPRLRNLNLLGNPLCDYPNYRLRVVDCLAQLQVLDAVDVTAKERELAPVVASQDKTLRVMVLQNHFAIQKLQKIARLVQLRRDFYGFVMAHVGGASSGSLSSPSSSCLAFDVLPNPHDVQVDVDKLLGLWRYEQLLSESEREALEIQMVTIVVRTHHKLAEHPKLKAKEFLLKLAARGKENDRHGALTTELRHECTSWDEAFGNVLALQQQTLASLQSLCERNNRELVASLTTLLTTDPSQRKALVNAKWPGGQRATVGRYSNGPASPRSRLATPGLRRNKQISLPPQQQDPDQTDVGDRLSEHPHPPRTQHSRQHQAHESSEATGQVSRLPPQYQQQRQPMHSNNPLPREETPKHQVASLAKMAELRSGDFGGTQTLSEAVHRSTLRESSARAPVVANSNSGATAAGPGPQLKEKRLFPASASFGYLKQPRVYTIQHDTSGDFETLSLQDRASVHAMDTSLSKTKTGFRPVSSGFQANCGGFEDGGDDVMNENHDLAVLMNQRELCSSSTAYGAGSRQVSVVDDSVETASSISSFSDVASSLWRHSSRGASDRQSSHLQDHHVQQRGQNRVEELSSRSTADRSTHARRIKLQRSAVPLKPNGHMKEPDSEPVRLDLHSSSSGGVSGDRHHELEDREEKYIKALIESEQRELELRNQLATFTKKLAQHQQFMAQELHEKQLIKQEVAEKVQVVAAPKVLKRFFLKWIHHYHWSLQRSHFERKRAFILQHNWFWRWRRKVWTVQRVRDLCDSRQLQTTKQCFAAWVNASQLAVITTFAKNQHAQRKLAKIVRAWRHGVKQIVVLKRAEELREQESIEHLQRCCFSQWAKRTRHTKQLKAVFALHSRHSQQIVVEMTFCRWKMVALAHARPRKAKVVQFILAKQTQRFKRHFQSWRNFVRGHRLYLLHLKRRTWTHWARSFRFAKAERASALRTRRAVLKERFLGWRVLTQDQTASRRSLSLAKRYVNQRRLRKLWLYWKCYTFTKRKYVQGSTKALKHYFIKLLRTSWGSWKKQTRSNLVSVREKKHSNLRRHFQALCAGIQLKIAEKYRARQLRHLRKRCDWALVHKLILLWGEIVRRRRQVKQYHQVVARQRRRDLVQSAWSQWTSNYLLRLRDKVNTVEQRYEDAIKEKDGVEAEVLRANDHAMSLKHHVSLLEGTIRAQEGEIATYQNDLLRSEQLRVDLEAKIKVLEVSHDQERQQWAAFQSQLSDQRVAEQEQTQSVADISTKLQSQIQELHTKVFEEQQRTLEMGHKNEFVREELNKVNQDHEAQVAQLNSAYRALEHQVQALKHQLVEEQQQKDETANRLQEYEARLATTCQDINQHEEAHERENERLHLERNQIEAQMREEQACNAELRRLLEEKNALIHRLSQQQQLQHHVTQKNNTMSSSPTQEQESPARLSYGVRYDCQREEEPISAAPLHSQAQQDDYWRSSEAPMAASIGETLHTQSESTIGSLLKDINQSILVRTGLMGESRAMPASHSIGKSASSGAAVNREEPWDGYCSVGESIGSRERQTRVAARVIEDATHIDEHANKVHEDIRQLQERIAKRLRQTPAATASMRTHRGFRLKSPCSSSTSLSEEEESDLTESEPLRPRQRREAADRSSPAAAPVVKATKRIVSHVGTSRAPLRAPSSENMSRIANAVPKRPGAPRIPAEPHERRAASSLRPGAPSVKTRSAKAQPAALSAMDEHAADWTPRAAANDIISQSSSESPSRSDVPPSPSKDSPDKSSPRDRKQRRSSPSKQHGTNKLNIDPNATLAAISAKLSTAIPPAESEIVRINREALLTVSKRYQQQVSKDKALDRQQLAQEQEAHGAYSSHTEDAELHASPQGSPTVRQKAGAAIPPALHESVIAEEWVNVHLETNGTFLLPVTDIQTLLQKTSAATGGNSDDALTEDEAFAFRKKGGDSGPLGRAGIDRNSLYHLGMPKDLVDRLYRALYVYTNGFHNIINEIAAHCPPLVEKHVSSNVWLTFLLLLEQCENGKYEMAMLKFKHATQEWRRQMQEEHLGEKTRLESQLLNMNADLRDEAMRSAEKSDMIAKLAADAVSANQTISDQHHEITAQSEQIRLLRLEILVHEDDERKLNDLLDDTRKDFEVANSERINALAERFALEEEMRKLQSELERIDAEKSSYAKRMHEGLFMNQALRATNETLKQNAVVIVMEKDKVVNEKDALQVHIDQLQQEIQELKRQKAHVERELLDSQRKTQHLDARIQTMKEQIEIEAVTNTKQIQEISFLKNEIDEEKVKVGVLEAKCNLLTAEKQNTGMRAQDKLRIERLLNQKLELENLVEAMKLDRAKDQEQIWNLRASLEALDTEMQHSKRVFSAGQQAFLHSERTCEQLRNQLQDVEKSYEKATKNLASLKERFKLFEENSKDQITKLEVELKVTNAQLREVSYANRDNTALIAELNKSLEVSSKELKNMKNRFEASEHKYNHLKNEKEDLQRDKTQRELQRSTSKNAIEMFIRALQHILALVKLDEYPFDEALRELLRMTHELFGNEIGIDKVLEDEDEAEEFEEELDEEDMLDEQRMRRKLRKKGLLPPSDSASAIGSDQSGDDGGEGEAGEDDSGRRRTQVTSMSKFRKSKLDKQVKKLQRDAENKAELIQSLEGVICEQADELAQLTRMNEQQERWLKLNENQKGLLCADIDATATVLFQVRAAKNKTEHAMIQAKLDRDVEIERAMQMQHALENLRRQFDMQSAMNEDLLSKIWREYEHYLLMLSLRRDKASQATVITAEQSSQTLVPHRNPATERARIASMYMPSTNPTATTFENVIQQINNNARVLLPEVSSDISVLHLPTRQRQQQDASTGRGGGLHSAVPVVHPTHRGGGTGGGGGRSRREADSPQYRNRCERICGRQQQSPRMSEPLTGLPAIEQQQQTPHPHYSPPHIIRHVNEFGTRQDVLISPVYPPYFQDGATRHGFSTSKIPKKPEQRHRRYQPHPGIADQDDERSSSPRQPTYKDPRRRSPPKAGGAKRRAMTDGAVEMMSSEDAGDTGLRYHRGFLRTGMEVLRGGAQQFPEDEEDAEYHDSENGSDDSLMLDNAAVNHQRSGRITQQHGSLSPRSPGRLEEAIRGYQQELGEEVLARRRRLNGYEKDDQVRTSSSSIQARARNAATGVDDSDDGCSVDSDMVLELGRSPFVPAVLYPLLPPQ